MVVIGLCGGSGSGKTLISALFVKRGFHAINADEVYHKITSAPSECLREIAFEFGEGILTPLGALDRSALREVVFADGARLRTLNSIAHKHVLSEIRREIKGVGENVRGFLVDAPLLFESGFDKECTATVAVVADVETRIQRIMARDGISRDDAERRISHQISDAELTGKCSYVIVNNSTEQNLEASVEKIINEIINKNT